MIESSQAAALSNAAKFQPPAKRLVTGGNDNEVRLWEFKDGDENPQVTTIGNHSDWVRDVAWCSNIGLMNDMVASCSEDGSCKVWICKPDPQNKSKNAWEMKTEIRPEEGVPLWKVSWSQVGNMLAISGGDNQVRIMSENANGEWKQIQLVNEETSQESSGAGAAAAQ